MGKRGKVNSDEIVYEVLSIFQIPDVPKKTGIPKSDNKNAQKVFKIQINM